MRIDYGHNEDGDDKWSHGFGHSLFVYSTVMSVPDPARVVVDAGLKSMAFDSGMPVVAGDCARLPCSDSVALKTPARGPG